MTIILDAPLPKTGRFSLSVQKDIDIHISAAEAQKHVTKYVCLYISSQMHGEAPSLMVRERVYWRVPVHLTFPSFGDVGQVGAIDVDVETGELEMNETIVQEIEAHAEDIARRIAPPAKG